MNINLTTYWERYLFGATVIALIISIIAAVHFYQKSQNNDAVIAGVQVLKNPTAPIVDTFTDKNGRKHAAISGTANNIPQASQKDISVKNDSVAKQVDDALNLADASHLMEVTMENIQLKATVLKLRKDSANSALLAYSDKWLHFNYDNRDSTIRNLAYTVKLNAVKYNKPKFLGSTPLIDFYADDPRVNISGFSHFTVIVPPPFFGLSADAKATYDLYSGHVIPSVGLDIRFGNIHLEGRNYWSIRNRQFQQNISAAYKQTLF